MLLTSRRRALTLLIASLGLGFAPALRRALAVEPEDATTEEQPAEGEEETVDGEADDEEQEEPTGPPECYDSKKFGDWLGRASDKMAGARINDVAFENPDESALRADVHVSSSYDCKLVLYADIDKVELSKEFLVDPQNRLIVRDENGKDALDVELCGNCADIEEDLVAVVLPLSTVPLLRERPSISIAIKLNGQNETGFKLALGPMREAIKWAEDRRKELADDAAEGICIPPQPE